jgi:hypothetical protein
MDRSTDQTPSPRHRHSHAHHHAPGVPHPAAALPPSLLRLPALTRLATAGAVAALMWAAVMIAMR